MEELAYRFAKTQVESAKRQLLEYIETLRRTGDFSFWQGLKVHGQSLLLRIRRSPKIFFRHHVTHHDPKAHQQQA